MQPNVSTSCASRDFVRVVASPQVPASLLEHGVHHRQELIPGFNQATLTAATINVVGAGAGSELARVLAKKGIGQLRVFDPDPALEPSNLPRQAFYREQLYQPKALVLPSNLAREATSPAVIEGHFLSFEEAVASGREISCNAAVVIVDSNPTRAFCSRYFREQGTPCLFTAFTDNADRAYVFVQDRIGPCWGCVFPDQARDNTRFPCAAAAIDLPMMVSGLLAYAIDSLLMGRKRHWNYRELSLSGVTADITSRVASRLDCPLCRGRE